MSANYVPFVAPKTKPKQTCTTCVNQPKCWALMTNFGKPVSTANITINILICRLQLGIDRDKTVQNLLQILRPGMVRLITHIRQQGNIPGIDINQLLVDMQSTTIEYLLYDYKIGDRGRATPYLFDPHQGFLTKWVKWIVGKNRRFYSHHELHSPSGEVDETNQYYEDSVEDAQWGSQSNDGASWDSIMQGSSVKYDPYNDLDATNNEMFNTVMEIIEDGVTLNSNEYRVMKFCLVNGNEANSTRHIDGLHIYLSNLMKVSRPRVTRLYARSRQKLRRRYAEIMEAKANEV